MFDRSDGYHTQVARTLKAAGRALLLTTWPCVTEAMHLLERIDLQLGLLTYIHRGFVSVRAFTAADLEHFIVWIAKTAIARWTSPTPRSYGSQQRRA